MLSLKIKKYFLGNHFEIFLSRRCLNSFTNENMLLNHKDICGESDTCTSRTSIDSHLPWKNHLQ